MGCDYEGTLGSCSGRLEKIRVVGRNHKTNHEDGDDYYMSDIHSLGKELNIMTYRRTKEYE